MITLLSPGRRLRDRYSSLLLFPTPRPVDDALFDLTRRWPNRVLADPPAGSGLKAVMGDSGLPFLGHTVDYIRFGSRLGRERWQRLGPVSWMGAFGKKVVVIAGPSATQTALANTDKAFSQDGWTLSLIHI